MSLISVDRFLGRQVDEPGLPICPVHQKMLRVFAKADRRGPTRVCQFEDELPRVGVVHVDRVCIVHGDKPAAIAAEILNSVVLVPVADQFAFKGPGSQT